MHSTQLPPLGALLAFEAAAESKSFAAAANRLFVTPAAISQQIRGLEQQLDIILFERSKRGVTLTRAGQSYWLQIHEALEKMRSAQQQIQQFRHLDVLTITALPSIASKWLMPLALQWMELNPSVEIRVVAGHATVDFNHSATDMCICFGDQEYPGLHREKLFTDSVSLVCSKTLLPSIPSDLEALLQQSMIHIDWGKHNANLPDWNEWLSAANCKIRTPKPGPRFNLSSMAIDAALQGKGLLLGQHKMIEKDLKTGALVQPLDINLPLGQAYYLVCPKRTLNNKYANAFMLWLKRQV